MSQTTSIQLADRAQEATVADLSSEPRREVTHARISNESSTTQTEPVPNESHASQVAEDGSQYPTGARFWLIILSVSLTLILAGMDASIVSTAVPTITDHFHTTRDVGLYSAVYRLGMCSLQFFFGKLYKLHGLKHIFLLSTVAFMIGSVICAAAPTSAVFIVGRAVCGGAGAGLLAGAFAALIEILPLRKRPLWASILNSVEGISVIAAPLVGGLILSRLSWRWCFWINLPLGAITIVTLTVALPNRQRSQASSWKKKLSELDLFGTLILIAATTLFFLALDWAGTRYAWNSAVVTSLLAASFILLLLFAYVQHRKQDAATLPPRILRNRNVIAAFVYCICCNSSLQVIEYYLPSYLQAVRDKTPLQSSVLMLPIILGAILGSLMQGAGTTLIGYYVPFMFLGSALMPVFAGLMTTVKTNSALVKLGLYSGFLGFSASIGYQAPQVAVQTVLPAEDANIGLGIVIFAGQFGPAVFVTAAQNVFSSQLVHNLQGLALTFTKTSIENAGLTGLKSSVPPGKLQLVLEGFDHSLSQTWYIAVALSCVMIVGSLGMEWRHIRVKQS